MEFTFELQLDGWALITMANSQQYRLQYNCSDAELRKGIHVLTSDGMSNDKANEHVNLSNVSLTRVELVTDCYEEDVVDTARKFLDAHGFKCLGPGYGGALVIYHGVDFGGNWLLSRWGEEDPVSMTGIKIE